MCVVGDWVVLTGLCLTLDWRLSSPRLVAGDASECLWSTPALHLPLSDLRHGIKPILHCLHNPDIALWFSSQRISSPLKVLTQNKIRIHHSEEFHCKACDRDWLAGVQVSNESIVVPDSAEEGFVMCWKCRSTRQPYLFSIGPSSLWNVSSRIWSSPPAIISSIRGVLSICYYSMFRRIWNRKHHFDNTWPGPMR